MFHGLSAKRETPKATCQRFFWNAAADLGGALYPPSEVWLLALGCPFESDSGLQIPL